MKNIFRKQLWISFGVVFGTIILAAAAIYFLSNDLNAQANKIISDKTLIDRQTAVLGVLAKLKSDAPTAAAYSALFDKLLPTHDALIGFPQWVAAIGKSHNVDATVVFQGNNTPTSTSAPAADGFSLTASGAMDDLTAFLADIESRAAGFLLSIDAIDLVDGGTTYRLTAQGRVFSR